MCEKILFGTMPDGEPVYLCRLDNRRGTRAEILSLGGIIRGIWSPIQSLCMGRSESC